MSYLYLSGNDKVKQFFSDILTYWVLYSNLVPIRSFFHSYHLITETSVF